LNLALVSEIRQTEPTPSARAAALSGAEQAEVDRVTVKVRRLRTVSDELQAGPHTLTRPHSPYQVSPIWYSTSRSLPRHCHITATSLMRSPLSMRRAAGQPFGSARQYLKTNEQSSRSATTGTSVRPWLRDLAWSRERELEEEVRSLVSMVSAAAQGGGGGGAVRANAVGRCGLHGLESNVESAWI